MNHVRQDTITLRAPHFSLFLLAMLSIGVCIGVFVQTTVNNSTIIIKGYAAVIAEIERLLSDVHSPETFVWANDIEQV
jgi:hypothetical protein